MPISNKVLDQILIISINDYKRISSHRKFINLYASVHLI